MSKRFIISFVLIFIVLFGVFAATYTPVVDSSSTYKPTQIVNGTFETRPWVTYTYKGTKHDEPYNVVNENWDYIDSNSAEYNESGWNTTEIKFFIDGNLFEWKGSATNRCVEMSNWNSAALYQDLTTHGGDVIKWSLMHLARKES